MEVLMADSAQAAGLHRAAEWLLAGSPVNLDALRPALAAWLVDEAADAVADEGVNPYAAAVARALRAGDVTGDEVAALDNGQD
jgi:hypothetical protein